MVWVLTYILVEIRLMQFISLMKMVLNGVRHHHWSN